MHVGSQLVQECREARAVRLAWRHVELSSFVLALALLFGEGCPGSWLIVTAALGPGPG